MSWCAGIALALLLPLAPPAAAHPEEPFGGNPVTSLGGGGGTNAGRRLDPSPRPRRGSPPGAPRARRDRPGRRERLRLGLRRPAVPGLPRRRRPLLDRPGGRPLRLPCRAR